MIKWVRADAGLYRSAAGLYEIQRAAVRYAGRLPWIVYVRGKPFTSEDTLADAKRAAERHNRESCG